MDKFNSKEYKEKIINEIENGADKLFYLKHLSIYLKYKGLPFSHPTILNYEKAGIIKSSRLTIPHRGNNARVYTGPEIVGIAATLNSFKQNA